MLACYMLAAGVSYACTGLSLLQIVLESHGRKAAYLWGHGSAGRVTCVCPSTPAGAVAWFGRGQRRMWIVPGYIVFTSDVCSVDKCELAGKYEREEGSVCWGRRASQLGSELLSISPAHIMRQGWL